MARTQQITSSVRDRAVRSIAGGALTNSKRSECLGSVYPMHVKEGFGSTITSVGGDKFIDFICGLGTNLIGYGNERIARAIADQYTKGTCYSIGSLIEVEAAEIIKRMFPFIHRLRFLKTGSEACAASVRIARSYKSGKVLSHGYHGWLDPFTCLTEPALGAFNCEIEKFESLDQIDENVSCVIVEPVITDWSEDRRKYLNELREITKEKGVTLIFDEIITGYRFIDYSVSSHWGIRPDLVCFGKAFAGGLPLSIVGGRQDIMECGEYFVSSTFAGETLSLRAMVEQFNLFNSGKYDLKDLWNKGENFINKFNSLSKDVKIEGYPTRGIFTGDTNIKRLLMQEAALGFILLGPSFFFNFTHIGKEDFVLSVLKDIFDKISRGEVEPKGTPPQSPFSERVRNA